MKPLLIAASLAALLLINPHATAADPAKPEKAPAATKAPATAKEMPFQAVATEVDASGFVHVTKEGDRVRNNVTPETPVYQGKAPARFADVKAGDAVSGLRLKTGEREYKVTKITKFGPKPAKK